MKRFLTICFFFSAFYTGRLQAQTNSVNWLVADLLHQKTAIVKGSPKVVKSFYGKAVLFDGRRDGIFVDEQPIKGMKKFTIEAIVFMASGGNTEQRFFHCGEVRGDRVLFETRTTKTDWFLDVFVNSAGNKKVMIDSSKVHPLDQWYHVALTVDEGKLTSFVNGIKEVEAIIPFQPVSSGLVSIGVRQNLQSWFKGKIYKIKFSPGVLQPQQFLKLK